VIHLFVDIQSYFGRSERENDEYLLVDKCLVLNYLLWLGNTWCHPLQDPFYSKANASWY
jgi:hypothetical protein